MELDDDYKFALDCEVNNKFRRTDAVRSSLLQLEAHRGKVDWQVFTQRRSDLLQEYSYEVDREDCNNSYVNSARLFAKDTSRKVVQNKWSSIFRKRLDEGMAASDIITSLNPKLAPMIELSKQFKNTYKNRIIQVEPISRSDESAVIDNNERPASQESISSEIPSEIDNNNPSDVGASVNNKIVNLIQSKIKPAAASSPTRSILTLPSKGSPTRVPGIFKRKGANAPFQPPRTMFPSNSQEYNNSHNNQQYHNGGNNYYGRSNSPPLGQHIEPTVDETKETRKASFVTGLEKHLTDEIMNNRMNSDQAIKIVEEVRKNAPLSFKNPSKKMLNGPSRDENNKENDNPLLKDERLKGIEKQMIEMIQSEIVSNLGDTDWAKIAGLDFAKAKIKEVAILPLVRPDLFIGIRTPPKGILLFGPPGTGKTMIGRCIASQAKATFFSITASTLTSKWIGDGEKAMKTLFAVARCLKPSVIFMDEIDSLLKSRSDSEHESSRRMKTEFLSQFDGLSQVNDGLLLIGTTNRPQELDEAVRRRFAAKLFISLPEKAARKYMIRDNLGNEKHNLTDEEIDMIAEKTEGYSGSDMKHLCSDAAMHSFKEVMDFLTEIKKEDIRAICYNDFLLALNTVKPSFSADDLLEYDQWNKKYGSN